MDPNYRAWVTDDFVSTFPTLLRQVGSLEFDSVNEVWSVKSLQHLSKFSTLSKLSLFRFGSSVPELCALISAFPHLEQCIIRSFRDLGAGSIGFGDCLQSPGPRLKLLHIKSYSFPLAENDFEMGFLGWILGTESRSTLQDVAITAQTSDIEIIGDFLRAVGPQLERLEIICQDLGSSPLPEDDQRMLPSLGSFLLLTYYLGIYDHLDLGHLTKLRVFKLHYPTYILIHTLVAHIMSPFIHTLSFHIRLRNPRRILGKLHGELAEILGRENLRGKLALVDFGYESDYNAEEIRWYFNAIYGDYIDPGVLRVRKVEPEMPEI